MNVVTAGVMFCLFMVTPTQGRNITEEICRSQKYDRGRLKCSEGYCRSLLTGRTTPNEAFNSNCEQSCSRCFEAIKDLLASKKLQTETAVLDPTIPPVTNPTYQPNHDIQTATPSEPPTDQISDLKNTTGPSQGNLSPLDSTWTTMMAISLTVFVVVVGLAIILTIWLQRKKRRGGALTTCVTNHSSTDLHYTPVEMDGTELDLRTSPDIPDCTVQPHVICGEAASDVATSIIQNGCAEPKCTSVVIDERRTEAAYGDQQRAASDMATHIPQNGVIPNGTASRMEPAVHLVQNATGSETDATQQMGAMPQSSTQQAAPNETGPQVGNIPQAPPNTAGASPPNDVPRMEANPQATNSNSTGGNANTTQQSAGAGGSCQSTTIGTVNHYNFFGTVPTSSEPAPKTTAVPQEHLSTAVQEIGKGEMTTEEVMDGEGGPRKYLPPD